FIYCGLVNSSKFTNVDRAGATFGTVQLFPGLGLSIGRLDFALGGIIVPHTHPRASELVYVEEGSVHAAIITSDSRLYARVITKGEVM
ncbi:hypothetical protein SELMODRAFT_26830, partial [Selaginella moellendorffii]